MNKKEKIIAIIILILAGISYRILPHPANFTPVAAISLFGGFYFRRYLIVVIPLIIMFASDMVIGFYSWKIMLVVYLSFLLTGIMGIILRRNKSIVALAICSFSGSLLFFLLTNFAVWLFDSWYPHTYEGLYQCFVMAIPFFRNTMLGDIFYCSLIFGLYEIAAQPKEKLAFIINRQQTEIYG